MKLLYGTTSLVIKMLTEQFYNSRFHLWLADEFSASDNPTSSNPYLIFEGYQSTYRSIDYTDPKFTAHISKVRKGVRRRLYGTPECKQAMQLINRLGVNAVRPYMAILEATTYERQHKMTLAPVPKASAASPDCIEYNVNDIQGPSAGHPELHLQKMFG
jgi:hypothetical protein